MSSWVKLECFKVPRKFAKDYSAKEFLEEYVDDETADKLLSNPTSLEEVTDKMGSNATTAAKKATKKTKTKKEESEDDAPKASKKRSHADAIDLEVIKENAETIMEDEEGEGEADESKVKAEEEEEGEDGPAKKKMKLSKEEMALAAAYNKYVKLKNSALKDFLRWNNNPLTGKKDDFLMRVIDGQVNGRFAKCPACNKGRLKLNDDGSKVICRGHWDEDIAMNMSCPYSSSVSDAPRLLPWYDREPTEEEVEEMKKQWNNEASVEMPEEFIKSINELDWNLSTAKGKKKAATEMTELLTSDNSPVAVPQEGNVKMEIGKIILPNTDMTAEQILDLIVEKYGLKEQNKKAAAAKEEAFADLCDVKENAKVFNVIMELADVYAKEANRNASNTYRKVAQAVKDLSFEITEDNAKGLGGGKNKVPGIGKKSAEYMLEFLKTGQIEKLEEKKASLA